ncbi:MULTISPECIES: citrate synthase [Microbacterium]|uniref:citrate synthase n=1 Tax=Microbacterium TaxID=33882 RepID=UPI00278A9D05|nr:MULTISPECIES: citrate synthase [Microbacterium]MDQ1082439.1 citrate synthase [Microbacterium sp. SORGH_AS_0344]MDQ1168790.1 citrate synthase [Microbacterium proteolyticum]
MASPLPRLSAAQVAARLGVKPETVYAYVSRGLLTRERHANGSTFDALEVEAFAASRRRTATRAPAHPTTGMPLAVVQTDIADIEDGELLYRGRRARDLAAQPFAEVVAWLWGAERTDAPDPAIGSAREMIAALPPHAGAMDRFRAALTGFAADDPLRHDTSAATLHRIGWTLLTGLPVALGGDPHVDIARSLVSAWGATNDAAVAAVNAALVLLIDHDLAVSTFAARVAASARADGYAAVGAALGAADSPLHIAAATRAAHLLSRVSRGMDAERALAEAVQHGHGIPGFGHPLYDGIDDRADALLPLIARLRDGERTMDAVRRLDDAVTHRTRSRPNVDLALAALASAARLPDDAASTIFVLGRTAGWIAHIAAEYAEPAMRLRPRGEYVGP